MMQSSEIMQIIISFVSTVGAVLCAHYGRKQENKRIKAAQKPLEIPGNKLRWGGWKIGFIFCILVAVVNTGILLRRMTMPEPKAEIKITYPVDRSIMNQTDMVRGTSHFIPDNCEIWVVVFPQEVGRYYPQNYPADVSAGGNWSSVTYIGNPDDTGKNFDIVAVAADKTAQDAFGAYLVQARDKSDWVGFERLPAGAVIHDRVSITRK